MGGVISSLESRVYNLEHRIQTPDFSSYRWVFEYNSGKDKTAEPGHEYDGYKYLIPNFDVNTNSKTPPVVMPYTGFLNVYMNCSNISYDTRERVAFVMKAFINTNHVVASTIIGKTEPTSKQATAFITVNAGDTFQFGCEPNRDDVEDVNCLGLYLSACLFRLQTSYV